MKFAPERKWRCGSEEERFNLRIQSAEAFKIAWEEGQRDLKSLK